MRSILLISLLLCCSNTFAKTNSWEKVIEEASQSIVSIRVNAVRPFDTQGSSATQATGFVVDAKRGIILTNRHVVQPGPITAEGVFYNSEEVTLKPIYRDPIHDFGFFRYDPKALKFIQPKALKLADDKAKVGDEIRIIGNDSGEKMSILSGTLARLDRAAPKYGLGRYNDFNTFYFQSSADTAGGSSGAPVINQLAEVIALNAGGKRASSSSYFLPLFKVTRALKSLQKNQTISRGTIQTSLNYQTYDEVRRLGLTSSLEKQFRKNADGDGLLTVKNTVPDGPAHSLLRPGDIVISLRSKQRQMDYVNRFEQFEIFLDEHVGQTIQLTVFRQDKSLTLELEVADLEASTPKEFISFADGIFNQLSYQVARQSNMPVKGVYVATPGYAFSNAGIRRGVVIQKINNQPIENLDDFQQQLLELSEGEYFTIKYVGVGNPNNVLVGNVQFQTKWHISERCKRNDKTGLWPCQKIEWNDKTNLTKPTKVIFKNYKDKKLNKIAPSLVFVNANLPYHIDGQNFANYSGTGIVIDDDNGLIIVDRNTVPIKMADVDVTFAGVTQVPASVLFVHPLHSFTLLQYDPKLLLDTKVKAAKFDKTLLEAGDPVWLAGYQTSNRLISEKLSVSSYDPLALPRPTIPQFKETNTNSVIINNPPLVASGVLMDKRGKVRSWWTNFTLGRNNNTYDRGLPIDQIINIKQQWLEKGRVDIYSMEVELSPITIASARKYGLSDKWMNRFQQQSNHSQVLQISKRVAGADSFEKLQQGDLLLTINQQLITGFDDFEKQSNSGEVQVSIWRDAKQLDLTVQMKELSSTDTENIYIWSGALLQKPHRAVSAQYGLEPEGVYVSWYWYGSPANRYGLSPLSRIVEFEGQAVNDLTGFIEMTKQHADKDFVRIRLLDLIGRESIITLKQDLQYWPTERVYFDGLDWKITQQEL
jgi:pro-apoptotic serine protease NMA111